MIFRIGHLGDTIVALPAFWALRRRFPSARLSLLTNLDQQNSHYVSPTSVLPTHGLFDEFIPYPANLGTAKTIVALLQLIKKLRRRKFDAAVYLMPRIRTPIQIKRDRLFFRIVGLSELLGSEFLLNNRVSNLNLGASAREESESNFLLRMLGDIGIRSDPSETDLLLTEDEIAAAGEWLETSLRDRNGVRLIGVGPGAKWESKIWSEGRFFDVVNQLIRTYDCHPIVFGGKEDREKGQRMVDRWGRGSNAAGALSVREAASVLHQCAMYLGNDTGTMHLAAAVGIPCVAIFAGVDRPGRWDPFGEQNHLFRSPFNCPGCLPGNCVNQKRCLDLIETEQVYRACSMILDRLGELEK